MVECGFHRPWLVLTAIAFALPARAADPSLFRERVAPVLEQRCVQCHNAQEIKTADLTLTGVAASMWNHASFLHTEPPRLDVDEMREVLSYAWARQFFEASGDAGRGRRVFAAKRCGECHSGAGPGPALSAKAGTYNGITMMSALWRHGPARSVSPAIAHAVCWQARD